MSHRVSEIQRFSQIAAITAISFFIVLGVALSASEPEVSTEERSSDEESWEELRNLSTEELLEELKKINAALQGLLAEGIESEIQPGFQLLSAEVEDVLVSSVEPSRAAPVLNKLKEFGTTLEDHGTTLKDLGIRFEKFEKLIVEESERIISLPLIKKDIESFTKDIKGLSQRQDDLRVELGRLHDQFVREQQAFRHEAWRVYGLFKWVIGAVFTLALSVAAMAIGPLLKRRSKHS